MTPTDRAEDRPTAATTPQNPPRPSEETGRPRREVRRPVKYQDYECYTLQPVQGDRKDWKMAVKNPVCKEKKVVPKEVANRDSVYEKELIFQEKLTKEQFHYLDQSGASDFLD